MERTYRTPLFTRPLRLVCALAIMLAALFGLVATPAHAATLAVCSSGCTYASIQAAVDAAAAGDTITIGAGNYAERLTIAKNLTLQGAGVAQTTINGGGSGTVVAVMNDTTVTIAGVTITGGSDSGIVNQGTLTVQNSTLSDNSTANAGGGIVNQGTLTLTTSTLSGNRATYGGGIRNVGTLTMTNSTLSGNNAYYGGGIDNQGGTATVQNSTLNGNSALSSGSGIRSENGTTTVANTIIASSPLGTCWGSFSDGGGNLNYNSSTEGIPDSSCPGLRADPKLGPLQNNGGPTQTHALLAGSPAIDAIPAAHCAVTTDQRGVRRPQGAACDIGAFELKQATDTTAPEITPTISGTLSNGWYSSDVTVSWSVVENESAIFDMIDCKTQSVTADTPGVSFSCSATSAGGMNSRSVLIKRDTTAPTITFVSRTFANAAGWSNRDVTVTWNCSDLLSGIVNGSVSQIVSSDGANQSATGTCTDVAGNSASTTQSGINIDKTAPTLSAAATTNPNAAGWYNTDVRVHFTCNDTVSGVTSCPADQVLSSEGDAIKSTAQIITDQAGNTSAPSNIVTVNIDKTAPTITFANRTFANAAGWSNGDVTVTWNCSDLLSTPVDGSVSQTVSSDGANQSATGTCTDQAGNTASDKQGSINIDKTAPTLNPQVSPNPVLLNGTATVTSGAADALSGLQTQRCGALNTSSVGTKSVQCSATDNAGNSATASTSYQVIYPWSGFFQPVDNAPTINSVKAGSAVPVKFSLGGNQGLSIFAAGYPVSQQISCSTSAPIDDIEQTVTASASSLQYDAATGQYSYVWKTDKSWTGQCRQLIVRLADGTDHTATFKFK